MFIEIIQPDIFVEFGESTDEYDLLEDGESYGFALIDKQRYIVNLKHILFIKEIDPMYIDPESDNEDVEPLSRFFKLDIFFIDNNFIRFFFDKETERNNLYNELNVKIFNEKE